MRPRRRSAESGFTLVEMLVTMVVMGVVAAAAGTAFISMGRASDAADSELVAQNVERTTVERAARHLRQAAPNPKTGALIDLADDDEVILYARVGGSTNPERLRFVAADGSLTAYVAECLSSPCGPDDYEDWDAASSTVLVTDEVKNHELDEGACAGVDDDAPVFTYYERSAPTVLAELSTPVEESLRSRITAVGVELYVDLDPDRTGCQHLTTTVQLRNRRTS